jgi:hypothetical protein
MKVQLNKVRTTITEHIIKILQPSLLLRKKNQVKFKVLTVTSLKMTVFWDVALRGLAKIDRRFRAIPENEGSKNL